MYASPAAARTECSGRRSCSADDKADSPCSPASICSSGDCSSCGYLGPACCADGTCFRSKCNDDNICAVDVVCGINIKGVRCCTADDGYDVKCGGDIYHNDDMDVSGTLCSAEEMCTACGQVGEQCCESDSCSELRFECDTATSICTPATCGCQGQPCCDLPIMSPLSAAMWLRTRTQMP